MFGGNTCSPWSNTIFNNLLAKISMLDEKTKKTIMQIQKAEITEYHIYARMAKQIKGKKNKQVLEVLSKEEKGHYDFWKKITNEEVRADMIKVWFYTFVSKFMGITFGLKLMENGEEIAQETYDELAKIIPEAKKIESDENRHERELLKMIDEEHLKYVGSIVLGLNDALVELTGALAGLTLALQNAKLIAVAGLVTGVAASLSMAVSEYLSIKSEHDNTRNPLRASVYTGIAYIFTVILLIAPYLLIRDLYISLAIALFNAIVVIAVFTFYVSVAQETGFRKRFLEMAGLSMSVALISFGIGFLLRIVFNIEV